VVPTESGFYPLERKLSVLSPDRHLAHLARHWLERLADPPPFWLLGSSAPGRSPYVAFARDLAGWWQVPGTRADARMASWPLAALAVAYARQLGAGRLPQSARMWVEKTPGSERFLDRIWRDFPAARVIQIVRRPEAVLASIKRMRPGRWHRRNSLLHVVRQMAPSYRIAAAGERRLPKERYRLVRYEDLTEDPVAVMREIAGFLGIAPHPSLLQPTVAGRMASNNSSFNVSRPDPFGVLDPIERALLALAVARPAARLGYTRSQSLSATEHRIVGELAQ